MLRAACLGLAAALAACSSATGRAPSAAAQAGRQGMVLSVGSFNFPESVLLAEIYGQALAAAKFPVRILPDLGPREVVDTALMDGRLQLVPEYAGSAMEFFSLGRQPVGTWPFSIVMGPASTKLFRWPVPGTVRDVEIEDRRIVIRTR